MNVCFCTLAIHAPYRRRARRLIADASGVPWLVLTDEPSDFKGVSVRAVRHVAIGPMARDFLVNPALAGNTTGLPAYHDKRFVLQEALKDFDTAIFMDADTRLSSLPKLPQFRRGIAVTKVLRGSIAEHLSRWGSERRRVFEQLAVHLGGGIEMLERARWFAEALFAVTKDGNENRFFEAWGRAAEFLHSHGVFTGEGGVIGLAAAYADWPVDYDSLDELAAVSVHEGRGPKDE